MINPSIRFNVNLKNVDEIKTISGYFIEDSKQTDIKLKKEQIV